MIKNYFRMAWRSLTKNSILSFVNIGGLATGMAVSMLIALWVYDELSFNTYHHNYNRIAQVLRHYTFEGKKETGGQSNPIALGTALHSSFGSDFTAVVMSTKIVNYVTASDDKNFNQAGRFMEPDAPSMLGLKMLYGSRAGLKDINSILLSETLAKKLFGNADPVNSIMKIDTGTNVRVTGVYEDLPGNTDFSDVTFIAPFELYVSLNTWVQKERNNWRDNSFPIYVQIKPETSFSRVSEKIKDIMLPHLDAEGLSHKPEVFLHPMRNWHLYSKFENGTTVMSDQLKITWLYSIIGMFVLMLACINFVNLSTARAEKRAKEVGVRKAAGSLRIQLAGQFLGESLFIAACAFVVAIIVLLIMLPWFNGIAGKQIIIPWANPLFWLSCLAFTFVTGLLAGTYPALYLSSLPTIKALKNTFRTGRLVTAPRKVLVVLQFTVSIALVIGTITIYRQIQFAKDRPAGYSREGLLTLMMSPEVQKKYELLRNELMGTGAVLDIAASASPLTDVGSNNTDFDWQGKAPGMEADFGTISVTHEYGKTIGWQFIDGRDFSKTFAGDSSGLVINESAAKLIGMQHPIGEIVQWNRYKDIHFKILGIVEDMVMKSPFERTKPTVFFLPGRKRWLFIKTRPAVNIREAIEKMEAAFKRILPSVPFDYKFIDDEYATKFASEVQLGKLANFFAALAILISCLGLYGLTSFLAAQRTREIGIRKVLGASVFTIWRLLSKDFLLLVVVACFIAGPVAYYFLHGWLQQYEYRTSIAWWFFVIAGLGAIIIMLLTVSFQCIKAALMNPATSLKTE